MILKTTPTTQFSVPSGSQFLLVLLLLVSQVDCLTLPSNNNNNNINQGGSSIISPQSTTTTTTSSSNSRRNFFARTAAGAALVLGGIGLQQDAQAACLPGDTSADCIGVYKLPYEDSKQSFWLTNKEALAEFAPDIRFIQVDEQPKTIAAAKEQLMTQRRKVKDIKDVVFDGDLKQAGVLILNLIPKVTGAGLTIRQSLEAQGEQPITLRTYDQSFQDIVAQWNTIDIEIGQALRGQRGVTAVAQIEILTDLKEATASFDDFLKVVEAKTPTK